MISFHDLYQHYSMDVYRFAYSLTNHAADAEDIASETFLYAWINFDSIRVETLKAYLFTIARNLHLRQWRKQKRWADLSESLADQHPDLEQELENDSELRQVQKLLQTFPENDRMAFILRVEHNLHYDEIARILMLSEVAVKVKVHRVRKKLLEVRLQQKELP